MRRSLFLAIPFGAALLAGCQTAPVARGPAIEGNWASSDGIFVASFAGGQFNSRSASTNAPLVTGGRYAMLPDGRLQLNWMSIQARQERAAFCQVAGPNVLACEQVGGSAFTLNRVA